MIFEINQSTLDIFSVMNYIFLDVSSHSHVTPSILTLYLRTVLLKLAAVPSYVLCAAANGKFLPRLLIALGEPQKGTADRWGPVLLGFCCRAEGLSGPRTPANPPTPF